MNGLPIYLTGESLYLGDMPVAEWVKAGSVSLVNVDYIDWELTLTLRVIPGGHNQEGGADLAVTTGGGAVGEDRLPSYASPPVALPTTPGSIIRIEDGSFLVLQRDGLWCDETAEKTNSHWFEVVFDAGAAS